MRPAFTFTLTLLGVLLAGLPLLHLTAEAPKREVQVDPLLEQPSTALTYAEVQFTGKPTACTLRWEGNDLANMPEGTTSPWKVALELPRSKRLELEAEIQWPEGSAENAVSITLTPAQENGSTDTRWTGEDGSLLHDLFIFTW